MPDFDLEALTTLCLAAGPPASPDALFALQNWSLAPELVLPLAALAFWASRSARMPWLTAAVLIVVIALVSPLCRLSATSAAAHMVQHVLLAVVAPLLFVLARPRLFTPRPGLAAALYGIAIWSTHVPVIYETALIQPIVHLAVIAVLLITGTLFWQSVLNRDTPISAIAVCLVTAVHTGMLGALLTFAPRPWYPIFTHRLAEWGRTPHEDQQLAGLIMWVPMSTLFLIVGLMLLSRLLSAGDETRGALT